MEIAESHRLVLSVQEPLIASMGCWTASTVQENRIRRGGQEVRASVVDCASALALWLRRSRRCQRGVAPRMPRYRHP
jgi:hypothetical protein